MVTPAAYGQAYMQAVAAWPTVTLAEAAFVGHLTLKETPADCAHFSDLYLVAACLQNDPVAVGLFDTNCLQPLRRLIAQRGVSLDAADEVMQALRTRLLVGDTPKIADYDGRGPLAAWVRVAAVRAASNLRRDEGRRAELAADAQRPLLPALDPELAIIQRQYGEPFTQALRDAFAVLDPEERNVLRLHFAEGLNLDTVARVLGISRATAGRRVVSGRERVREEALRLVGTRIRATPEELESLLGIVRSKLDLSLGALASLA